MTLTNSTISENKSDTRAETRSQMTILVIEDSRFLRIAIERILIRAGCRVVATGDGREGLEKATTVRPDLILLDLMLPTMEGIAVLRQLKQDPVTKTIPVLVLSGLSQKNEDKVKAEGASAYFEKSLLNLETNGNSLLAAIQNLMAIQPGGQRASTQS
jgi:CheY-like chemotaxis protein